jgi:hypothetical protein
MQSPTTERTEEEITNEQSPTTERTEEEITNEQSPTTERTEEEITNVQSPTTESDKRRAEYFSIFISELRYCNPAFKFGSISFNLHIYK